MDIYEGAYEKLKNVENKREGVDLDDFEEFMRKVEEVNKMVHALTSNNKAEIEEASKNADAWLKNQKKKKRWWTFIYALIGFVFFYFIFY
mgnify:CR=1 FL=1